MKLAITVGLWHCVALDLVVSNPINVIKCLTWVASEWNMRACLVWISKFSLWRYLVFNYVHLNCNIIYILYVHPRVPGYMQWWIFVCESCLCISCGMADIQWCQGCVWLNKSVRSRVWRAMDSPRDWAVTYINNLRLIHYIYMNIAFTLEMLHAFTCIIPMCIFITHCLHVTELRAMNNIFQFIWLDLYARTLIIVLSRT